MEISTRHANEIIKNLKSVINEDINFISPDGTIIASSDEERVGNFHEGATIVAKTGEPLYWNGNPMYSLVSFGPMKDACGWTKKKDAEVAWRTGACEKHYPDAAIMNAHTHEHSDGKRVIQRVMPDLSVYYLADVSLSSSCLQGL